MIEIFMPPLMGALIGWIVVHATFWIVYRRKNTIIHEIIHLHEEKILTEQFLQQMLAEQGVDQELEMQFEDCMDSCLQAMKLKFPMGGMFLNGSIMESLKATAKDEFIKILPQLRCRIVAKIIPRGEIASILGQKMKEIDEKIWKEALKPSLKGIPALGALIGIILGSLQLFFLNR